MTKKIPAYLRRKKGKTDRSLIARFRCRNKMGRNQHWRKEKERKCRICEEGIENIIYVLKYVRRRKMKC